MSYFWVLYPVYILQPDSQDQYTYIEHLNFSFYIKSSLTLRLTVKVGYDPSSSLNRIFPLIGAQVQQLEPFFHLETW